MRVHSRCVQPFAPHAWAEAVGAKAARRGGANPRVGNGADERRHALLAAAWELGKALDRQRGGEKLERFVFAQVASKVCFVAY